MKKKFVFTAVLFVVLAFASACSVPGAPEDFTGLVEALRTAGATVETGEPVEQPFLSKAGQIVRIDGADLQVFEYGSAEALEADAATISPDGGSTDTTMITWMATPHFFKSGRLLVLYVGDDAATLGLLETVLGEQFAGG
ncbi:MAG TPA: hypothetical protein VMN57_01480 [Anaerolineales bacterium]|nr:hypothetical protein [Anaerolineales bacterium]